MWGGPGPFHTCIVACQLVPGSSDHGSQLLHRKVGQVVKVSLDVHATKLLGIALSWQMKGIAMN